MPSVTISEYIRLDDLEECDYSDGEARHLRVRLVFADKFPRGEGLSFSISPTDAQKLAKAMLAAAERVDAITVTDTQAVS